MNIPLTKIFVNTQEENELIETLRSGWVMQGPKVAQLEETLASYLGMPYVIAVNSGTAALHAALLALGIGKGDEVIVPSFSYIATAHSALYVGAIPVFADIEEATYNIDPQDIEKKITQRTKVIVVAHQVGLMADMDAIMSLAKKYKLFVIEDAACALGARYQNKFAGTFGDIACFSFHPRKSITTAEGGIVVTKRKVLADLVKSIRTHGRVKNTFLNFGYNFRMSDIHAALGVAQFKKLEKILSKRKMLAETYNKAFKNIDAITIPFVPENSRHTYQSYVIVVKKNKAFRDSLIQALQQKGIASNPSIMIAHKEPFYKKMFGNVVLSVSEKIYRQGLILPLYPQMTKKEQQYVIDSVLEQF